MKGLKSWVGGVLEFIGEKLFGKVVTAVRENRDELSSLRQDIAPIADGVASSARSTVVQRKKAELDATYGCDPRRVGLSIAEQDRLFRQKRNQDEAVKGTDQTLATDE